MSARVQPLPPADLDAYLARIGYDGPRTPDLALLAEIQRRHVFTVPFENLDIHLGRPIRIDLASVTQKLVHSRRGGYCFEQNTLLRAVLLALGFRVTSLLGRVRWQVPPDQETPLTHMLLVVELAGTRWLVDGGFGSSSLSVPLRLDTDQPQATLHDSRRILRDGDHYVQQTNMPGEWAELYRFLLQPAQEVDYEVSNWYTSTAPQSRFVLNLVSARTDHGLRYTLLNREFTTRWTDGRVEKRELTSPDELLAVLAERFHLHFPPDTRFSLKLF